MIVAFRSAKDANVNAAFAKRKATIFAATCISSQARRADTSSAGSREAPVCLERTLNRPEKPTQTCGKPEGSLSELADSNSGWLIQIVSTLRAFCFFGLYDEWRGLKENL